MAIASLSAMTEFQYIVLLVKLITLLITGLVAFGGFAYGLIRFSKWVWTSFMSHVKASFEHSFCTPADMDECKLEQQKELREAIDRLTKIVLDGFASGESTMSALRREIRHTNRRVDEVFIAMANDRPPSEPGPSDSSAFDEIVPEDRDASRD